MKIADIIRIYGLEKDVTFQKVYVRNPEHDNLSINIVVLTGGPCGGKSDLKDILTEKSLLMNGFKMFFSSEAAESLISEHVNFVDSGADDTFQREIIELQLIKEKIVIITSIKYKIDHPYDAVFCIMDRSLLDGMAYFDSPGDYLKILSDYGLTSEKIFERSDRVIFMQSSANGAEEYYKTTSIRKEPREVASKLDRLVQGAWREHPDFQEVLNKNFLKYDEKIYYALGKVFELVGFDTFGRYKLKYYVAPYEKEDKNTLVLTPLSPTTSVILQYKDGDEVVRNAELKITASKSGAKFEIIYFNDDKPDSFSYSSSSEHKTDLLTCAMSQLSAMNCMVVLDIIKKKFFDGFQNQTIKSIRFVSLYEMLDAYTSATYKSKPVHCENYSTSILGHYATYSEQTNTYRRGIVEVYVDNPCDVINVNAFMDKHFKDVTAVDYYDDLPG